MCRPKNSKVDSEALEDDEELRNGRYLAVLLKHQRLTENGYIQNQVLNQRVLLENRQSR